MAAIASAAWLFAFGAASVDTAQEAQEDDRAGAFSGMGGIQALNEDVFQRISDAVQPVLSHDLLVLTELDDRARTFRVVTYAGSADALSPTGAVALTERESERRLLDFEIARDIPAEVAPVTERDRFLLATGMRSWLGVPVRLSGEVRGSLSFFHREPGIYSRLDVEAASRLSDHIALVLAHQRLADEARIAPATRRGETSPRPLP